MSYRLAFKISAKKEWCKLDASIREQFKKKLVACTEKPGEWSFRLNGVQDYYKIKLRSAGYRLVYQLSGNTLVVSVVAVGKRERNSVFKRALS